jgi:hypothetical protein
MSHHAHNRVWIRTVRPLGVRPQEFFVLSHSSLPSLPPATPRKPLNFDRQNLRKPQQNPTPSTLVNREILVAPPPLPGPPPNHPGNGEQRRGVAIARGVMDCGGKRHAAFVRATVLKSSRLARACESAVAAVALPAQSKTRTGSPGASELRGAPWSASSRSLKLSCARSDASRPLRIVSEKNQAYHLRTGYP